MSETYAVGQVRKGRVTRIADFGAFVELEPGVEALAHASTFAPAGGADEWTKHLAANTTAAFEIVNIDADKRRIGVALVPEGSSRAAAIEGVEQPQDAQPAEGFGSLADKLRGAMKRRD